jgi:hypothetical protein
LAKARKEHIIELRASVEQMTERLEELKAAPFEAPQVPAKAGTALAKRPRPSLWKHAAVRQLERRRKAEEDNVQLRDMLELQVQEAKCLQRILKRRTKIQVRCGFGRPTTAAFTNLCCCLQMMEGMLGMKRRKLAGIDSAPSNTSQILKAMMRDTDAMYADVDTHFMEKEVKGVPSPGQRRKVKRDVVNGTFCLSACSRRRRRRGPP